MAKKYTQITFEEYGGNGWYTESFYVTETTKQLIKTLCKELDKDILDRMENDNK